VGPQLSGLDSDGPGRGRSDFSLKMDRCPAELTVADLRFYRVFTQVLNSPFIRGVPQSNGPQDFRIVHLHNKWVHRTTIRRSIHNI
jgi:hypothetical protein